MFVYENFVRINLKWEKPISLKFFILLKIALKWINKLIRNKKLKFIYRIPRCRVHPLCLFPSKFDKILVFGNFIEQNFYIEKFSIINYWRKIFLIFLFIKYYTTIIKQSSSYFFRKFFSSASICKISMKLARAVSSSSSSFASDHLKSISFSSISRSAFSLINFINWFLLFFIISSEILLLYSIKILTTGRPVIKFLMEYIILSVL